MTPSAETLELTTLPPSLPSELILLILEQHLLDLSSTFFSQPTTSTSPTCSTYSSSILPLLLSSSQIYHLLLPLLYTTTGGPFLSTPAQSSHLLYTLATTSPSRHLSLLHSLTHSGPLDASFVSLLNAFGSQLTSLTLLNVPLEDELASSHGGGASSALLSVLSECNPVAARIELVGREVRKTLTTEGVEEVEKGSLRRRVNCCAGAIGVGGKKMGRMEGEEQENDAGLDRVQKTLVGGSVWDVVELGVVGWKRWEQGWIEVREE